MKQARVLAGTGRFDEARRVLDGLRDSPALRAESLWLRGEIGIREGRFEAARENLVKALESAPGHPGILHALAGACHVLGDHETAIRLLEQAVEACPTDARAWQSLALVCHGAGRYRAALNAYGRASAADPGFVDARVGEARVWQLLGELDRAQAGFEAVLREHPGNVDAIGGLAVQAEIRGEGELAGKLIDQAAARGPLPPELVLLKARLATRAGEPGIAVEELRGLVAELPDPARRAQALFALGAALDRLGEVGDAFAAFEEANRLKPGSFDAVDHAALTRGVIDAWTRPALERLAGAGSDTERPVFIVGMPRSGTSLLEQMLAAHPEVTAGGEIRAIGELAISWRGADGVVAPDSLDPQQLADAADAYLQAAGGRRGGRFTDKMPANFAHLGLIQAMFPRARVIHCVRDPADTGLSCFFQDFSALGLAWSRRIEDIAAYFRDYRLLMDHWRAVLDLQILAVRYESLVRDPERELRRILEFLGLAWDAACLSHADSDRPVVTASHDQATRPVYTSAIGRYRPYRDFIGPLLDLDHGESCDG